MDPQATRQPLYIAPTLYKDNGQPQIKRVLIANRGEIACRIIDACQKLCISSIAVYTDVDENAVHVQRASEARYLGSDDSQPYLNGQLLLDIALSSGADAIHPGYGYLSENAKFASAVRDAGLIFVGPSSDAIAALGDKGEAKTYLKANSSVPLIPGYSGANQDPSYLKAKADEIGYPIMIKASAGGGGRGMRIVYDKDEFFSNFTRCASEAQRSFGSAHCLIEKYIQAGKHVEIQIVGDGETAVSLLDRECSVQRRHQKVIEESPCSWMSAKMRTDMSNAALEIARLLKYESAGTVEFIVDVLDQKFYFLEVNTRIQVEHPITEEVTGVDIVALQFYLAAGGKLSELPALNRIEQKGHAIEVRLCAEDPFNNFLPCNGIIKLIRRCDHSLGYTIPNVRYELGVQDGSEISVYFDSMISKIVVWSHDRPSAIRKMLHVLQNTICLGITTNQVFLQNMLKHPGFQKLDYTTAVIADNLSELTRPSDVQSVKNASAIVATLFSRAASDYERQSAPRLFRSIPPGFRNQRKDRTRFYTNFLECDFKSLGHLEPLHLNVANEENGQFRVWPMPDAVTPTPEELETYFNKTGGALVKRYYATMQPHQLPAIEDVRVLESEIHSDKESLSGSFRLQIGGRSIRYWVTRGYHDELKTTVYLQSNEDEVIGTFHVSGRLTWAGKLTERSTGSSAGDPKTQYLSPFPGKVLQILVQDGVTVKEGDGLLVLESMKMEVRIEAAISGTMALSVKENQLIQEGDLLCKIRTGDSDTE